MAMDNERALPTSTKGAVQRSRLAWSIEVNSKHLYFDLIINIFRQCLEAHMQGGVLVVANAIGSGVCFRPAGGVSGINMSKDYFG